MGQNRARRLRTGKVTIGKRKRVRVIEEQNRRARIRTQKGRGKKKKAEDPAVLKALEGSE